MSQKLEGGKFSTIFETIFLGYSTSMSSGLEAGILGPSPCQFFKQVIKVTLALLFILHTNLELQWVHGKPHAERQGSPSVALGPLAPGHMRELWF